MPRESMHEQIAAKLEAKLASIAAGAGADDYHYTPTGVSRARTFSVEMVTGGGGGDHVYLLRPEDETTRLDTTGRVERVAEFFILGARRRAEPGIEPWEMEADRTTYPHYSTVQNRIVRDIEKLLTSDVQLRNGVAFDGGFVDHAEITDIDRTPLVEGWVIVLFRIEVTYDTTRWAP